MSFTAARTKFSIGSLDDASIEIEAQYNPTDLQVDQQVGWTGGDTANSDNGEIDSLSFTKRQPATMKVELLFDGAENNGTLNASSHHSNAKTVRDAVEILRSLAAIENKSLNAANKMRAHFCVATWGNPANGIPRFECVVESISVKYTMFAHDGTVLRATVTLSLKAARRLGHDAATADMKARLERSTQRAYGRQLQDDKRFAHEARMVNKSAKEWSAYREGRDRLERANFASE